jgi:hypothetical protein
VILTPKGYRVAARFDAQPYPLYAVTIEKASEPNRFQLADTYEPVRLVIGWRTDDDGDVTPLLAGGQPGGTPWTGPVFYEETRDRAEQMAKQIEKADRSTVREARVIEALEWLERKQ